MVRSSGFEPPRYCYRQPLKLVRLPVPPRPHEDGKNQTPIPGRAPYFAGAAGWAGTAGCAGIAGTAGCAGTFGADDAGAGFENCSSTERPPEGVAVLTCTVKAMVVNINMIAHHVVAMDKNVAAARGQRPSGCPIRQKLRPDRQLRRPAAK